MIWERNLEASVKMTTYMMAGIIAADARPYPTWASIHLGMFIELLALDIATGRMGGLPFSTSSNFLRRHFLTNHFMRGVACLRHNSTVKEGYLPNLEYRFAMRPGETKKR